MDWKLTALYCQLEEWVTGSPVVVTHHRGLYRVNGGEGMSRAKLAERVRDLQSSTSMGLLKVA